jgi:hypothetical protein
VPTGIVMPEGVDVDAAYKIIQKRLAALAPQKAA